MTINSKAHIHLIFSDDVPGFSGAHSQAETLDELQENLREAIKMLLEDEELVFETEFVGTQQIVVQ